MDYSLLDESDSGDGSLKSKLETVYDTHAALLELFDIPRIDIAVSMLLRSLETSTGDGDDVAFDGPTVSQLVSSAAITICC